MKERKQSEIEKAFEFTAQIIAVVQDQFQLMAAQRLLQFFKEMYGTKHGSKKLYEILEKNIVQKISTLPFLGVGAAEKGGVK